MAREEAILLFALLFCAFSILQLYGAVNRDAVLWAAMLLVQSLPYWAALAVSMINAMPNWRHKAVVDSIAGLSA